MVLAEGQTQCLLFRKPPFQPLLSDARYTRFHTIGSYSFGDTQSKNCDAFKETAYTGNQFVNDIFAFTWEWKGNLFLSAL